MATTFGLRRSALFAFFGLVGTVAAQTPAPPSGPPTVLVLPPVGTAPPAATPTPNAPPPPALTTPPGPAPFIPPPPPPPPGVVDLTPPDLHTSHGEAGKHTFESHPGKECCKEETPAYLASIEYLLVRPRRRGNDYAIADPTNNLTPEGRIKSVGYEADSGLRASIGFRGSNGWELVGTYYYLHSGDANNVGAPAGGLLYATMTRPGIVDEAAFAAGNTSLNLHVYDVEAAKTIRPDESTTLRLSFGPRIASMGQDLNAFYFGRQANGTEVRTRTEFDVGGLTAGANLDWCMGRGFHVFGKTRTSILFGEFTSTHRETDFGGLTTNADVEEHYNAAVPVLELGAGVAYQYRNVQISAGYEVQNWFNVVDGPQFTNDFAEGKIGRRKSDLSLEGIFLRLGVAY